MRRIVKFNYIGEKVTHIKKMLVELEEAKSKLKSDIESVSDCFTGPDGSLIKNIYLSRLSSIDKYIENIKRYSEYYAWVSSSYKENYFHSKSAMTMNKSNSNVYYDTSNFGEGVSTKNE